MGKKSRNIILVCLPAVSLPMGLGSLHTAPRQPKRAPNGDHQRPKRAQHTAKSASITAPKDLNASWLSLRWGGD
eukprot:3909261-Pyramimonas_sp.AAC.1